MNNIDWFTAILFYAAYLQVGLVLSMATNALVQQYWNESGISARKVWLIVLVPVAFIPVIFIAWLKRKTTSPLYGNTRLCG